MCGIVGILKRDNGLVNVDALRRATDMLAKRGPNDSGMWVEREIGFGHRRLAVLDVTPAAHQPMISRDGRYVIVYNGEIYNYLELRYEIDPDENNWQSNSDTEVVLYAYAKWGHSCINRFHGMFAFVIWDRQEKVMFAARDRMGVKPFYYHYSQDCFAFASRPNALFVINPKLSYEIDEQALRFYMECGYIPAPHSIYRTIKKLPPAHYLFLDGNGLNIKRYWDFCDIQPDMSLVKRQEESVLDELDEIIVRCVQSRMISDVPMGAFLSGGIDSSLVVAIMAKHSTTPIKTFTIGFEEKSYDESRYADMVAKHLGTEHYYELLRVNDLLNLMPAFLKEYDEPFFDSSALPTMALSRLASQHVTVSLSGDGGDELFGGYHYYRIINKISLFYKLPEHVRMWLASLSGLIPEHKARLFAGALRQPQISSAFAFLRGIEKDFNSVLLPEVLNCTKGFYDLFVSTSETFPAGLLPGEQGMRLDGLYTLPDNFLQKVDIASMAFSLESREPLLDHDLVEWSMKLPMTYKLRKKQNKYLLRKLAYRYIPKKIIERPKHGFVVPIDVWLRDPCKEWAQERFNDYTIFHRIPLNQKKILELFKMHISGERNAHPLLWAVLMFIEFVMNNRNVKNKFMGICSDENNSN
ncbi:asparagine synthetase B [Dissulfurispira thermophila]|uniref:asparagine synthase (glutamine-hydrolyzing) n=2 Tax=root TaxID=1 RepID=A0A7G1H252_9BACT|nr:asparagine synthase (glutamine-hydrolyzing) [Dissulfurispira thermophila]BCB96292.1 asparagine synthetase B [Dissulfurispira thermophila]